MEKTMGKMSLTISIDRYTSMVVLGPRVELASVFVRVANRTTSVSREDEWNSGTEMH
jgi:hypothetical protein